MLAADHLPTPDPIAITDKEGMGVSNSEIVHLLFSSFKQNSFNNTRCAVRLLNLDAGLQRTGRRPAAFGFPNREPRD